MRLADFSDPAEAGQWRSIDDGVMGGRSEGRLLSVAGASVFQGNVSFENGGGFASVRRSDAPVDLSAFGAIELRVRGDGKRYKLNLRTSADFDGLVFQAGFVTLPGTPQTVRLHFSEFTPRVRGRLVPGEFDPKKLTSLGLLISDRQGGRFRLELTEISAQL